MSFIIYPAIDIKDSKAVRLLQGDMDKATTYASEPYKKAIEFEKAGAKWIHVVDLNGAFEKATANMQAIKDIVDNVSIPLQLGGGIRTMENIDTMLSDVGVQRVILGTVAAKNPQLVKQAIDKYGIRIAVGIDALEGYVAVNGWAERSEILATDLAKKMMEIGVKTIIYTDIAKDGMMQGANIEQTKKISDIGDIDVILSGGIASMDDIVKAKDANFAGAITGKAIYTGTINLDEVLKIC